MSDTRRWREPGSDTSDAMRAVMQHAQRQGPSSAQVEALTAKVLAQMPQAPIASASNTGLALGAKLGALGLLVAGSAWWWAATRVEQPRSHTVGTQRTSQTSSGRTVGVNVPPPEAAVIEPFRPSEPPAVRANRRKATSKSDVSNELQLLHAARIARRVQPEHALALLRQHEREYPRSTLGEERDALMIELMRNLDPAQSERRLKTFEQRYPHSPYQDALHK